ncbi:MAG: FHA domain-containing protein [Anaerolineae bacterium]|nr:FHA domain-containing protein [Anaerolineae bacterium]
MSGIILLGIRILAALALYSFLVWALWLLWRGLQQHPEKIDTAMAILQIQIQIGEQEQRQQFHTSEITIGRAPTCECFINSKTVSTRHARLSFHHGQWWAEDLGSTNGTLLNQEKLLEPTVLMLGDILQCGEAIISIQTWNNRPEEESYA